MSRIEIARYTPELRDDWAAVLADAKNGIFLFDRDYMEYHSDRYVDVSALAYVDGRPAAIFPASIENAHAVSHAGLTFGGLVLRQSVRGNVALEIVDELLPALKAWGANRLTVRLLPHFLWRQPAAELDYGLWRHGFALSRRDLSSVIRLEDRLGESSDKRQNVARARRTGVELLGGQLEQFYPILEAVLVSRHGVRPVHSLNELQLLQSRFPEAIKVRTAGKGGVVSAGAIVYDYKNTWHTQYMAVSDEGRSLRALDFLIDSIIVEAIAAGAANFSFGASTEQAGTVLNGSLLWQKESFGARAVTHDTMEGAL